MKPGTKAARPPHQACTDEYAYQSGGGYAKGKYRRSD